MLGLGIGLTAALIVVGSALLIVLAIGFGHALGRGKPKPFRRLDTGDYVLWYLVSNDWNPENGRGTACILISRSGETGVSCVQMPMRCLRGYDNEQLTPEAASADLGTGFALAEIVEKKGEHLLRLQRPASVVASATEAEMDAVDSLAGFAPATVEPPTPSAD